MSKLILLVGLPGSGKSTYAEKLNDYICVSSDNIRKELYGDENIQGNPQTVFQHMHDRTIQLLKQGRNVVYDTTNVSRKNRRGIIDKCKSFASIECHVIWTPYEECVERDAHRKRTVGTAVIKKMLYRWESPHWSEGFSNILIVHNSSSITCSDYKIALESSMRIDQDNPHHAFTLLTHCSEAHNWLSNYLKDCPNKYKDQLLTATYWHDCGKPLTKFFKTHENGERYAHYYNHDNVGGYLIYGIFTPEQNDEAVLVSWLVSSHMQPYFNSNYYKSLDPDLKYLVDIVHEADVNAH